MKYRAVIFDLDGVIVHTDRYHYQAWKSLADELEIPFDERDNNRLRGVSRMESLDIVLERYPGAPTPEEKEAMATRKNDRYRALLERMTPGDLSEEVSRALQLLRDRGLKLAIGSSSKNAGLILRRIGLEGFFDAVSDGNNITRSKPDPEVFLLAAGMLGFSPGECLVVEDAKAGVEAAKAGGFHAAAMGDVRGYEKADHHLARFQDILEIC